MTGFVNLKYGCIMFLPGLFEVYKMNLELKWIQQNGKAKLRVFRRSFLQNLHRRERAVQRLNAVKDFRENSYVS